MTRANSSLLFAFFLLASVLHAQKSGAGAAPAVTSLLEVKRVFVGPLVGGSGAESLRELIIASLDSSKIFTLTDNPDRADAVLKGAADDQTFTDSFDIDEGINARENGGVGSGRGSSSSGRYGGLSIGDNESRHTRERKHEAYAAVRLCNREGDVLWSTTQESLGAKFRGASADVAAKVAHQLALDVEKARHPSAAPSAITKP
ncbi:MAG: hypothetical protein JOY62_00370 [Acidobacteriaceae bacterium]|nr:hypothetical protein [Acidobacteriaceae bacterium]MBV9778398.1 hypothetical protein [Acidobacteriaceae bacterium]